MKYLAAARQDKGKSYAYVIPVKEGENLVSVIMRECLFNANICTTKKQAIDIVNFWNYCFKQDGIHIDCVTDSMLY